MSTPHCHGSARGKHTWQIRLSISVSSIPQSFCIELLEVQKRPLFTCKSNHHFHGTFTCKASEPHGASTASALVIPRNRLVARRRSPAPPAPLAFTYKLSELAPLVMHARRRSPVPPMFTCKPSEPHRASSRSAPLARTEAPFLTCEACYRLLAESQKYNTLTSELLASSNELGIATNASEQRMSAAHPQSAASSQSHVIPPSPQLQPPSLSPAQITQNASARSHGSYQLTGTSPQLCLLLSFIRICDFLAAKCPFTSSTPSNVLSLPYHDHPAPHICLRPQILQKCKSNKATVVAAENKH